ncbi:Xpo1-domain-containing protein [Gonapodya prolifera JEL478]|uniref:Exportin-T n=1 Tax=Gonapodya prolifera (strain JEL478) TaxID=1344416 RepID=A0A139AAV9_GONPJ|nr:Xpo1-domain-containing protein [Gonapodya prolifera JEL478]|eukprot:KXS13789.1 Xpo1-domain-containing protein [Gonapodya prolifera JEL478]
MPLHDLARNPHQPTPYPHAHSMLAAAPAPAAPSIGDLEAAVLLAFSPTTDPATKVQATTFCEEVRASEGGWRACLELFSRHEPASSVEARFFTLGVLEDVVRNRWDTLSLLDRGAIRTTFWTWLGSGLDTQEPISVKNKAAQLVARLFRHLYLVEWPTFWADLLSLLASRGRSAAATDTFLRICLAVDEEVVSKLVPRLPEELKLNQSIKDAMRERDVPRLVEAWLDILARHAETSPDVAALCLRITSLYVSWVDIRLVATPAFLQPLYGFILNPGPLRAPACDCLRELVLKGMPPRDKLNLFRELRLPELLGSLRADAQGTELGEHVARLVNAAGSELTGCWEGAPSRDQDVQVAAAAAVAELAPHLIASLSDEYDETSQAVMPFLGDYLTLLKRQKRSAGGKLLPDQYATLAALADAIVRKMKYDEEASVSIGGFSDEGDDDEAEFAELRHNLKTNLDAVAAIDSDLYTSLILSSVRNRLQAISSTNGGSSPSDVLSWSEAELALYLLFQYGDTLKGQVLFVVPAIDGKPANLTPLGEMMTDLIQSNISSYPHPSIPVIYFETISRYGGFFDHAPHLIPLVLQSFVDTRGLHHRRPAIRLRINYLFLRFLRVTSVHIARYAEGGLVSIQDLLTIRPEKSSKTGLVKVSMEAKVEWPASFDSQLFLFEAAGVLISAGSAGDVSPQRRVELLQAALTPLLSTIVNVSTDSNGNDILPLVQSIAAIGTVGRGLPDVDKTDPAVLSALAPVMVEAFRYILTALQVMNTPDVWEVTRTAYQRIVNGVGAPLLEYLEPLVRIGLLPRNNPRELCEFLPSLGLLMVKLKSVVMPYLDALLWILLERILDHLRAPISMVEEGTIKKELGKTYLGFLGAMFGGELDEVFTSPRNHEHLNVILESVIHLARDFSDAPNQRSAFTVLARCVLVWAGSVATPFVNGYVELSTSPLSTSPSTTAAAGKLAPKPKKSKPPSVGALLIPRPNPLPGFVTFVYDQIVPVSFDAILKPGATTREAQSHLTVIEIVQLHKCILAKQGDEYLEFLRSRFLPSWNCPPNVVEGFVDALQNPDLKVLKKFMEATFLRQHTNGNGR